MEQAKKPRYAISVAAELCETQAYTQRYNEKIGFLKPARSPGNIRLYSEYDLILIRKIQSLMDELGVNLAGVEVILRMSKQLAELQERNGELENQLQALQANDAK